MAYRLGGLLAALIVLILIGRETIPFEIRVSAPLEGSRSVDPSTPIRVEGAGLGSRLIEVRLQEEDGTLVHESHAPGPFLIPDLRFGQR